MRPTSPAPIWFDIGKYLPALNLGFRDWATQIGNRFYLGTLLDAGKLEEFDELFNQVISDPFVDLGFSGAFPSDKAVYPLTFGVAKTFTKVLAESNCVGKDVCDEKLYEFHPDIYAGQAHLFVNLRAPNTLLIKQFSNWLEESLLKRKREPAITESVTQTWAVNHPILPYQDLRLWHMRNKKVLPSDFVMTDWLSLESGNRDTVRAVREKAKRVFTLDCYFDLKFSASDSEPTEASPPLPDVHD